MGISSKAKDNLGILEPVESRRIKERVGKHGDVGMFPYCLNSWDHVEFCFIVV
jgi:hypothetical protein